jgi:predicted RNA binding protein YcfA (HicA-like mRNA interferase family)
LRVDPKTGVDHHQVTPVGARGITGGWYSDNVTAREAMSRLRREGWAERPGKGSHTVFSKEERTVAVPNRRSDISPRTLRSICRGAGWEYPPEQ